MPLTKTKSFWGGQYVRLKGTEDNSGKCCEAGARTTVGVSTTHIYDLKKDYAIFNQDPYFEVLGKWMQTSKSPEPFTFSLFFALFWDNGVYTSSHGKVTFSSAGVSRTYVPRIVLGVDRTSALRIANFW